VDWSPPEGEIAETVSEVLDAHDATLVELSTRRVKGRFHIVVVAFKAGGIGLDTLSEVHRLLRPRLESMLEDDDLHVEFTSPGIDRKLKSFHEFGIFVGSDVSFLTTDGATSDGTIVDAEQSSVTFRTARGEVTRLLPEQITKARLKE
jgi:ribosome maturation factor RimP